MTNWTAVQFCSLAIDTAMGFTGVSFPPAKQALKVTCTVSGTVQFKLNNTIPVKAPQGLAWGFHATSASALTVTATVATFNASNVQNNTANCVQHLPGGTASLGWVPVQGATGSNVVTGVGPVTHGTLVVSVPMTIGQVLWIDTVGVFASVGQVLIDWISPSVGNTATGGTYFTDLTGRVRFDGGGVTCSLGRQDEFSDVQTGTATFDLQNDDGWFSTKNNASPWYPGINNSSSSISIGKRMQVNATDETGKWYTRFDGQVAQFDYAIDQTGNTNVCSVTCNDVLALLNRQIELPCWTKSLVISDPTLLYHWTLDDATGNGLASETSGNGGPPLQQKLYGGAGASISWQGSTGSVETLADGLINSSGNAIGLGPNASPISTINFAPVVTHGSAQDDFTHNHGYQLQAQLPIPITPNATGHDFTVELWFTMDQALLVEANQNDGPFIVLGLGDSRDGYNITVGLHTQVSGDFHWVMKGWASAPGFPNNAGHGNAATFWTNTYAGWVSDNISFPHHLALVFTGSSTGATLSQYVDGVLVASGPTLAKNRVYDWITVGGPFGGYGNWWGDVALCSVYASALSGATITEHVSMGQSAMWDTQSDVAIQLLGELSGIPSYWNGVTSGNGLSYTEYFDISGSNALSAMQQYEQMEHGFLFVTPQGQLTFHTRDWRMGYGAPDLTVPTNIYTPDLGLLTSDQFLTNIAAFSSSTFASGTDFENAASIAAYGPYANGTAQSPNSIPLQSYSSGYATLGVTELANWSAPYLDDISAWTSQTNAQPQTKCSSMTIDLLTLGTSSALAIHHFYALSIDNMVTLSGLPGNLPTDPMANDYFIEGWQEIIGQQTRTITYYTTPAISQRAWSPGDATYGKLDSTAVPGISQASTHANGPRGKRLDRDPGPPYWAPTFSSTMNNPLSNGHEFIGANDMRGLTWPLAMQMSPPLTVVGQQLATQSIPNATNTTMQWDIIFTDNLGAMGFIPAYPNWYCCLIPGLYEVAFSIVWTQGSDGGTHHKRAKAMVVQKGAQRAQEGTFPSGDITQATTVCAFKSDVACNASAENDINTVSNQLYLGVGDMISVQLAQDSGAARTIGGDYGGSMMSVLWLASGTTNDQW